LRSPAATPCSSNDDSSRTAVYIGRFLRVHEGLKKSV
jgi:hypothetical protein